MRAFTIANLAAATLSLAIWPALSQSLPGPNATRGSRSLAAVQTAKRQCLNACRARYRDCRRLNQLPLSDCQGIYQDCTRYTCTGLGPG
jgi:hypothetical protein